MNKIIQIVSGVIAVVALIIAIAAYGHGSVAPKLGGLTNFDTLATAGTASDTDLDVTSLGTSTVKVRSTASGFGGCIQLTATNGSTTAITASTTAAGLVFTSGTCL